MNPGTITGKASISFSHPVYFQSCASVVGPKEGNGPLKSCFDMICEDPMFGEKKWEAAESTLQKEAAALAIGKAGLTPENFAFLSDMHVNVPFLPHGPSPEVVHAFSAPPRRFPKVRLVPRPSKAVSDTLQSPVLQQAKS